MTYHDSIYMNMYPAKRRGKKWDMLEKPMPCSNARLHWSNLALDGKQRSNGEYPRTGNSVSFGSVRHNDGAHVHIQQKGGDTTTPAGTQEDRACTKLRGMRGRECQELSHPGRHHASSRARMRRGACNIGRFTGSQLHEMKGLCNDISTSNIHSCFYMYTRPMFGHTYLPAVYIYSYILIYNEISENAKAPGQV